MQSYLGDRIPRPKARASEDRAGQIDLRFAEFYRACVVPDRNDRAMASDVMRSYDEWRAGVGARGVSFTTLKRLMAERGHRHFYSNWAWYDGCRLQPADPLVSAALLAPQCNPALVLGLVDRIDAMAHHLAETRTHLLDLIAGTTAATPSLSLENEQ